MLRVTVVQKCTDANLNDTLLRIKQRTFEQ